jgi:hypothetical protein
MQTSPFQDLLNRMMQTPTLDKLSAWAADAKAADAELLAEYKALLARMDWTHEFSDDGARYRKGRETLRQIRALQPLVDEDRALFNAARPEACGVVL